MRYDNFRLMLPLCDTEGGGAGGGVATPPAPAAPAAPAAPSGGAPAAPAAPAVPAAPATPSGFTYKEDRSNWVPSHRQRQVQDQLDKVQRDLHFERQRVAALSGVQMPTTPDPESDAVRAQFAKLYPGLSRLEAKAEALERAAAFDYEGVQSSQQQVWVSHGNQVLNTLTTLVKDAYNGAELSPKAMKRIQQAFVNEVAEDPDIRARYEAGDMTIVSEFVKDYTGSNLDPYRRSTAVAGLPNRAAAARLPRGGGGSAVVAPKPSTLKPSDGDPFHKGAYDRFIQG